MKKILLLFSLSIISICCYSQFNIRLSQIRYWKDSVVKLIKDSSVCETSFSELNGNVRDNISLSNELDAKENIIQRQNPLDTGYYYLDGNLILRNLDSVVLSRYKQKNIFIGIHNAQTVAAGGTSYGFVSGGPSNLASSATQMYVVIGDSSHAMNAYIVTGTAQPATGSLVAVLYRNGFQTNIVITIPAGAPAGVYYDKTHIGVISEGIPVCWQFINNATSASAVIASTSITVEH